MDAGFGGLNGIVLVMDWAGRTCQVVYLINFDIKRESDVMAYKLKIGIANQVCNITFATCKKVV